MPELPTAEWRGCAGDCECSAPAPAFSAVSCSPAAANTDLPGADPLALPHLHVLSGCSCPASRKAQGAAPQAAQAHGPQDTLHPSWSTLEPAGANGSSC